jgi:hypothetical protein
MIIITIRFCDYRTVDDTQLQHMFNVHLNINVLNTLNHFYFSLQSVTRHAGFVVIVVLKEVLLKA